jgi:hypothetical protein
MSGIDVHGLPRVNDWLRNRRIVAIVWRGFSVRRSICICEFCICSTNKVPGGRLFVSTFKIYEHTNRKWSLCSV